MEDLHGEEKGNEDDYGEYDQDDDDESMASLPFPVFAPGCRSLVSRFLTRDMYGFMCGLVTDKGCTLADCIAGGVAWAHDPIGLWAADAECYVLFQDLFTTVIGATHPKFSPKMTWSHPRTDLSVIASETLLEDPDPFRRYIPSVRISAGRNIVGFPFSPGMNLRQRTSVLSAVFSTLGRLEGELHGTAMTLEEVGEDRGLMRQLSSRGLLPGGTLEPARVAAGVSEDWPLGRGLFFTDGLVHGGGEGGAMGLCVWVNEEEHIRVICTENVSLSSRDHTSSPSCSAQLHAHAGEAALKAMGLVARVLGELERDLHFERNDQLGHLTASPTNVGTALSVTLALSNIRLLGVDGVKEICRRQPHGGLHVQPIHQTKLPKQVETSSSSRGGGDSRVDYLICNKLTLGLSEEETLEQVLTGAGAVVSMEENLVTATSGRGPLGREWDYFQQQQRRQQQYKEAAWVQWHWPAGAEEGAQQQHQQEKERWGGGDATPAPLLLALPLPYAF